MTHPFDISYWCILRDHQSRTHFESLAHYIYKQESPLGFLARTSKVSLTNKLHQKDKCWLNIMFSSQASISQPKPTWKFMNASRNAKYVFFLETSNFGLDCDLHSSSVTHPFRFPVDESPIGTVWRMFLWITLFWPRVRHFWHPLKRLLLIYSSELPELRVMEWNILQVHVEEFFQISCCIRVERK